MKRKQWKRLLPLLGTIGLLAWLFTRVSPAQLWDAFQRIDWHLLVPMTWALAIGNYLWDAVCITWLFHDGRGESESVRYRDVLRLRGVSYLFSVINWGLGQGLLVYVMSRLRKLPISTAAGRCVAMAYVDVLMLLGFGLLGVTLNTDPRIAPMTKPAIVALVLLGGTLILFRLAPRRWLRHVKKSKAGGVADILQWRWSSLLQLCAMRSVYFVGGMIYLGACLRVCGIYLDYHVVISILAVIAMLDGLPISIFSLGTRENALILLLNPEDPAVVVAFCLIWSLGVVSTRVLIGLLCFWHPASRGIWDEQKATLQTSGVAA